MQRPFLFFLAALISGIIAGHTLPLSASDLIMVLVPFLVCLLLGVLLKKSLFILLSVPAILFLQGSLSILTFAPPPSTPAILCQQEKGKRTVLEGIICEGPEYSPGKTQFVIQATGITTFGVPIPLSERVLLTVKGRPSLKYGDFIRCETRLHRPENFKNPGGYDYEKRLRLGKIFLTGFISDASKVLVLREDQGNAFKSSLEAFRDSIRERINRHSPFPERTVLAAMILGDSKEIPQSIQEKFNITGTSHILAVSGFNVSLVALWTIWVIRWMLKRSAYLLLRFNVIKLSLVSAFLPVLFYTFVAGAGMSVLRATVMALVFMTAILVDRRQDLINTLAAAAFLILMISPEALFDLSFQLSFAAVGAILLINPLFTQYFPDRGSFVASDRKAILFYKIRGQIGLFLITTLSATLGTLPILAFYFNRLSVVVIPANAVLVPILGLLALPVSMLVIAVSPLSDFLAGFLLSTSAWLVKISLSLVDFFASLPGAAFYVCTPSLGQIAAFYLLLIFCISLIHLYRQPASPEQSRKKLLLWTALALTFLFLTASCVQQRERRIGSRELRVTAIDVHQGSSTLVRFPGGKTMLVDGGGLPVEGFDIGRSVVAPFLWHEGIRKIDIVVLSHVHADHLGGLPFIVENFSVSEVWSNGENVDSETYRHFLEIIRRKGIRHRILKDQEYTMEVGEVGIRLFNPGMPNSSGENPNEQSLVMQLTFGNVRLLLPGDISADQEAKLLEDYSDLRSSVLFVPHHGSRVSSSMPFLKAISPQLAVISCGPDNVFEFPHEEALTRYQAVGAKIFRTDRQGAVTVSSDGEILHAEGFLSPASAKR